MRTLRAAALISVLGLVAGCGSSQATSATSDGRSTNASPSAAPLSTQTRSARPTTEPTTAPSSVASHWEAAGVMPTAMAEQHAVLLGDGRVLAVGNDVGTGAPTAALWDPSTGSWHTTESLKKRRTQFAVVSLADGLALVAGGLNDTDQSYSSTYIYDPGRGHETWSKSGLLGTARTAPAAAVLPDGRVLVAGGYYHVKPSDGRNSDPKIVLAGYDPDPTSFGPRLADVDPPNVGAALATAELFDPAAGGWSATGAMTYARSGAAAVTLADGRVLVVGSGSASVGVAVDGHALDSAEIFDPKTGRFSLAGRLPKIDRRALEKQGIKGANAVPDEDPDTTDSGRLIALNDGGAVLIGRAGWWKHVGDITRSFRFDQRTNRWSEIGQTWIFVGEPGPARLETPGVRNLAGAMVARLPDGRVLVAGGSAATPNGSSLGSGAATGASAELYDPTLDTWSPLPSMPDVRAGGAAVVLEDGSVLLVGGLIEQLQGRVVLASAIRFVPSR